jgi:acyl carrier protein
MTDQEIFDTLSRLIRNVLGVKGADIKPESVLVADLGAESIDLLDLSFLIEDTFGITIEPNEFEKEVTARLPDGRFEKEGFLTDGALVELRRSLPEVDATKLVPGFRKAQIPSLLTVGVFVRLIKRKLETRPAD